MMLSDRNAWGQIPGPILLMTAPTDIFTPHQSQYFGWSGRLQNAPQQQPLETWKTQGLLLTSVGGYIALTGSHSEVMGGEQRGHSSGQS